MGATRITKAPMASWVEFILASASWLLGRDGRFKGRLRRVAACPSAVTVGKGPVGWTGVRRGFGLVVVLGFAVQPIGFSSAAKV